MQRLKVGDLVQITTGKDKGKRGKIQRILKGGDRVLVEGLNMVTRHQKPNQLDTEGGRFKKEAPLSISNVMPIDADTDRPTRIKIAIDDDGNKTRVSVKGNALKQG
ncbi:MAG: 50S ribosomal protein L24 [Myxococcota bacterium]